MRIRKATLEDYPHYGKLAAYCFGYKYDLEEVREQMKSSKYTWFQHYKENLNEWYTIEEDNRYLGGARCVRIEQNIRGQFKKVGAFSGVISAPETRREGNIRELTKIMLKDLNDEGFATSIITSPFLDSFYAKFGYANAPFIYLLELKPIHFQRWQSNRSEYSIRRFTFVEGLQYYKEIYKKIISVQTVHGSCTRSTTWWDASTIDNDHHLAVIFNKSNQAEGIIDYSISGFAMHTSPGLIKVHEMHWLNLQARNTIFSFFYRHLKQVVKLILPISYNTERYYLWIEEIDEGDPEIKLVKDENWMVRIVNVEQAIRDLPSSLPGSLVFQVKDAFCEWNNFVFKVTSDGSTLKVLKSEEKPTFTITIEGLSALVYGISDMEELIGLQWIQNLTEEAQRLLNDWFPLSKPWTLNSY